MPERRRLAAPEPMPRTPTLREYETHLRIDEHELQTECRNQPELFYHVARDYAASRTAYEDAKADLKRIQVDLEIEVRTEADNLEQRVTEGRIAAVVADADPVQEAGRRVLSAKARIEELEALKEAYIQRKDMLRELVALHLSNYYADPIRGAETRMRDVAVEGVRAARRRDQERKTQQED